MEKRLELEESGDFSTPEPDSHLTAVSNVLSKMLSREVDIQNVKYFSSSKSIRAVKEDGTRVSIDELSHGAKSVLTMAAQLAMNCCALNPRYKEDAPAKTPGIILIDEIDLLAHRSKQLQYEQSVPIANVPAELVCGFCDDLYYPKIILC